MDKKSILCLYNYYSPDDVAGAIQFTGLCEGLVKKKWDVEVWSTNRSCHHYEAEYSTKHEIINGVKVRRVWRPGWKQHRFWGRIAGALWVFAVWKWRILFSRKTPDAVIIGTDPIFSILLTYLIRLRWPRTKIAHWCFDLYPEYAESEGIIKKNGFISWFIRLFMKPAYKACDLVADLGPCMRDRLARYPIRKNITLNPWALAEPTDPQPINHEERSGICGSEVEGRREKGEGKKEQLENRSIKLGVDDKTKKPDKLCLLYSGNFGRPHEYKLTLQLARKMRNDSAFIYSARGSRLDDFKSEITPEDTNIRFVPFAPPERLMARLSAPDIHIVSLVPHWTGVAFPSKFFGAIAVGRPILFEGSPDAGIARYIREYGLGWVLTEDNLEEVADDLMCFSVDEDRKREMFRHCHEVYQKHFSKKVVLDSWNKELNEIIGHARGQA